MSIFSFSSYFFLSIAGGLALSINNGKVKVIKFSFQIRKNIERVRKEIKFEELGMRIGVHTGTVLGGVVGTNLIRFDIYGEDAKIANKMESCGEKGKINISEETKKLIESCPSYKFTPNDKIQVRERTVNMFFVEDTEEEL